VVDACLIPEVPFALKGTKGLFAYIEKVLEERGHCVMCIAEGAGQVSFERAGSELGVLKGCSPVRCSISTIRRCLRVCMLCATHEHLEL
jgi:6-phosphofructokinase 1